MPYLRGSYPTTGQADIGECTPSSRTCPAGIHILLALLETDDLVSAHRFPVPQPQVPVPGPFAQWVDPPCAVVGIRNQELSDSPIAIPVDVNDDHGVGGVSSIQPHAGPYSA